MSTTLRSLSGLLDFEAAARLGGFKCAAVELHKTPAALSEQVRNLEAQLGLQLFVRHARHVSLTPAGQELAQTLGRQLAELRAEIQRLRLRQDPQRLVLSTTHSLALKWLVPRLPDFSQSHPALDVHVEASDALVDLGGGHCDLALRYQPFEASDCLYREHRVVLAAPALLAREPELDRLLRGPLLCEGDGQDWRELLGAQGLARRHLDFSRSFSHGGLLVQAAVAGQGLALAPFALAAEDLRQGRLRRLPLPPWPSAYGYRLLVSPLREQDKGAQALAAWLRTQLEGLGKSLFSSRAPAQTRAR